jgi:hypothetical protein
LHQTINIRDEKGANCSYLWMFADNVIDDLGVFLEFDSNGIGTFLPATTNSIHLVPTHLCNIPTKVVQISKCNDNESITTMDAMSSTFSVSLSLKS